jgi:two-component system response regulator PilR (NtrC family)
MAERILVVDDETTLGANIARFLERAGHHVRTAESGSVAIRELDQRSFDLVITDLRLPDIDGLSVLDHVRAVSPETVTLIMTAYASLDSAVEALRRGAHDYIMKPLTLSDLRRKVESMAAHRRSGQENARLRRMLREESGAYAALRSSGPTLSSLCATIEALAGSTSSVLVTGEAGTGKELVARAIHETSARAVGPFLTLDVSATRDDEIDARLYGVESRGEGPSRSSEGLFRAASSGTLFLEGIGDMSLRAQARLLRALESRSIVPVGGDREVPIETRVVASSNRDLAAPRSRRAAPQRAALPPPGRRAPRSASARTPP